MKKLIFQPVFWAPSYIDSARFIEIPLKVKSDKLLLGIRTDSVGRLFDRQKRESEQPLGISIAIISRSATPIRRPG